VKQREGEILGVHRTGKEEMAVIKYRLTLSDVECLVHVSYFDRGTEKTVLIALSTPCISCPYIY
jgi:hypothetical protein